jgi:hypothetical protein
MSANVRLEESLAQLDREPERPRTDPVDIVGEPDIESMPNDDTPHFDYGDEVKANGKTNGHAHGGDDPTPLSARPESLTLEEMLVRFVHVARGPLIVDVSNTYRRLRAGEFTAAYAHNKVLIAGKAVPTTALWSQSAMRMTADCLTFHPGEPQFFIENGLRHLNIWNPPAWPPVHPTAAAWFIDHLAYLIPDARQREDLLDWLAHAAQRPEVRPHFHFLLVAAQEGTGRSWLVEILRRVWGERHAGETDLHRLLDDAFNSVLSGKILMAVHEVKAPADERFSHRDRLKSLLTDTSLTVNEKHQPRWSERFCARFLMFTNRDDALPLAETDRRVYAVRCADQPRDSAYYTTLYSMVENRTLLAAVWQLLRTRDISRFNPGARAPLNEMKAQMIAAGRTDEQQTAAEFLKACRYPVVSAADLMRLLAPEILDERPGDRKARTNALAAVMRELGAQTHHKKVKLDGKSGRVWILHNVGKWSQATSAALAQEASKARQHLSTYYWNLEGIVEAWESMP